MANLMITRRALRRSFLPYVLVLTLILTGACSSIGLAINPVDAPMEDGITNKSETIEQSTSGVSGVSAPVSVMAMNPMPAEPVLPPTFEGYNLNPITNTDEDHLSTFAMDVDTASYTLARGYLLGSNQLPPADAIRTEEFINYLPAQYTPPTDGSAFAIHLDASPSPFADEGKLLLRVGIQGQQIAAEDRDPATLIFVIDISGSMDAPNRLPMVRDTLTMLVTQLRQDDQVGIVVYSDNARVVLTPTPANDQQTILNAIASLHPEGSTYAEAGLRLGYEVAREHLRQDGTTRVILLSDGVANVGETGPEAILQTIRQGVEDGVTLSTIGFGMGTYNDVLMEQLANDGNGSYFYVDTLREARRVFVNNLTGTLQVIGYDAKIQVDFNPDVVSEYRLLGYENRAIADEDFRDDTVDAGEVGAGHSVTALYELTLKPNAQGVIATAQIRYEDAETRDVVEQAADVSRDNLITSFDDAPVDFRVHAAMAELAELLRGSEFAVTGRYADVIAVVEPMGANDIYAVEIGQMAQAAQALSPVAR